MIKILSRRERQEIENYLHEQFGIENIPGTLIQKGEERIFIFTGSLSEGEINKIRDAVFIERIGIYFAKIIESDVKLSIEGTILLGEQIKKNVYELDANQVEPWMKGQDLDIKTGKKGFLIVKYKDDFLGCGKASEEKIGNFIPKSRRLKEKSG